MRRLKVGITAIENTDAFHLMWSNGIGQNIIFLGLLLQRLDIVGEVSIVTPSGSGHPLNSLFGWPVYGIEAAADKLDLIIELGARALYPEQIERLRKRGGKIVSYVAGNIMAMNFEELARGLPHGDDVAPLGFDAAWITPQHWHMCRSYSRITRSEITRIAPHIWDPICINQTSFQIGKNPFFRTPDPEKRWMLGCFDPNVNVVKTFHLPLLITEMAYRKNPELIKRILLFSTYHLRESVHINELFAALDLGRDKKIFVEQRHRLIDMLGTEVNAVVTHQWQNNLNYLYWEILYLGWPLIHNSTEFRDVGYYYPEFDTNVGGATLNAALEGHESNRIKQSQAIRETLWRFSLDNPTVKSSYEALIEEVMQC